MMARTCCEMHWKLHQKRCRKMHHKRPGKLQRESRLACYGQPDKASRPLVEAILPCISPPLAGAGAR